MTLRPFARVITVAAALSVILVATSPPSSASLAVSFDTESGSPGSEIRMRTIGEGACQLCPPTLPLFFVAATSVDTVRSPSDPLLTPVGQLHIDSQGNGSASIVLPRLTPGQYMVMAYCEPCAATSAGRRMLPIGPFPEPFNLTGDAKPSSPSASVGTPATVAILVGIGAVVAIGWLLLTAKRRRDLNRDVAE
jgi:hypothetical protein